MFSSVFGLRGRERSSFKIRRGLDLPIAGPPDQLVFPGSQIRSVAVCPRDYVSLRPKALVKEGDAVRCGDPLFCDRKYPQILFTSPGCGIVTSIEPGPRRTIRSFVVQLQGGESTEFRSFARDELVQLSPETIRDDLLSSGLWTALRTRPFGRVPNPDSQPQAIFVRAMDSNPLAADPAPIIGRDPQALVDGLRAIGRLTSGPLYLCQRPGKPLVQEGVDRLRLVRFQGPHPAGLVGTHIHFLHRVGLEDVVWYLDYQDAMAIGQLLTTGRLPVSRIVALCGPMLRHPRLVETRLGSNLQELLSEHLLTPQCRVISGSVLSGRTASAGEAFLGRYDSQVSVLQEASPESPHQSFWKRSQEFSIHRFRPGNRRLGYRPTTARHGATTVMIPLGSFERVMPLDLLPTPLLRALAVGDVEQARALGCLELEEEDLALCSLLCPGKLNYGRLLRSVLEELEKEV